MMEQTHKFVIATYNIHKARGMDRKVSVARILEVLREVNPDIVTLQEVVSLSGGKPEDNQGQYLADKLGMHLAPGYTRKLKNADYGNVTLSRFPVVQKKQYDVSVIRREPRMILRSDVQLSEGRMLHVFNIHLGTDFLERRYQARKLLGGKILDHKDLTGPRIVLGDFNEWTRGLTTRMLKEVFRSADIETHLKISVTYPGMFPMLHLDHIYFDSVLHLEKLALHKTRTALVASDHLPLVGEFYLHAKKDVGVIGL